MVAGAISLKKVPIPVLLADDSIVFRRFLRDTLADTDSIAIGGEAKNGIEALDLVLKVRPRVILMDMEMPLMDGMTALQHLMIHCPTPTIMFSSLTSEGTFRAFDALKNGAVDFLSKDLLFDGNRQDVFRNMFIRKILSAAQMTVHSIEPVFDMTREQEKRQEPASRVVFCEDCGARNIIVDSPDGQLPRCRQCGDVLEQYHVQRRRRNALVTILAGGEGCFRSLLNIIPKLDCDLGGAVLIMIRAEASHIDTFAEYLDSISPMKVLRAREGMSLEGGFCYVAGTGDQITLQQFSAQQTLVKEKNLENGLGPTDLLMRSVASVFKNQCAGILLSSGTTDGIKGMAAIRENGGESMVLSPAECLISGLARMAIETFRGVVTAKDDGDLAGKITNLYSQARSSGTKV